MGKIVGSYIALMWLVCSSTCLGDSMSMRVFDMDGSPLTQAGAGHPFIIELTITDVVQIGSPPEIKGIEQFDVKNSGVRITSINGKTTSKYVYEVRIDIPGSYSIGPAIFSHNSQQMVSNVVRVVVGKRQIEQQNYSRGKKKMAPVLLRLYTDKERAVVGERITCRLRFYNADPNISLGQLREPELKSFCCKNVRGPIKGSDCLEDVDYKYIEWEWDLYPREVGACIIPAYGADYDRELEREDLWGGLGKFFGNHVERKRVYSNAISLHVDALPSTDKEIQGTGRFTALNVTAQPSVAKQGEGVVVTVEVLGDGDSDSIFMPGLKGVPPALKYYESKQEEIESSKSGGKFGKRFEYIVQGIKTGSWEIPSQSFYYYDVDKRSFNMLYSAPLTITVMPGSKQKVGFSVHNNKEKFSEDNEIADLHIGPWYPVKYSGTLPWWLFFVLVVLPIGFIIYRGIGQILNRRARVSYRAKRARRAFIHAREQLADCIKKKDVKQLYKVFTELFADRWQISMAAVSVSCIEKRLHDVGMSKELCEQWNNFFSVISERAFGVKGEQKQDEVLFNQAKQWIDRLEKIL